MDDNSVTVTNNENPVINLEISTDTSSVNIESAALFTAAIVEHNSSLSAHSNIIDSLRDDMNNEISDLNDLVATKANVSDVTSSLAAKANTTDVNTSLTTKANQSTTYTKTEVDTALSAKVNASDTTITKQGNAFNGNSQLLQTTSLGKYPAIDGSLITNLATYTPKGYSHVYDAGSTISVGIASATVYYPLSSANILSNQTSSDFTWSNGVGTCVTAGKYRVDYNATISCATANQILGSTVFKNGAGFASGGQSLAFAGTAGSYVTTSGSRIMDFVAGNTLQLAVTNNTAANAVVVITLNLVLQRIL